VCKHLVAKELKQYQSNNSEDRADSNKSTPIKVSLVIPAYNEERFIEESINRLEQHIHTHSEYDFSVVIAEDGSTDNTYSIVKLLATKYDDIAIRHSPIRLGKGKAVKDAWRNAEADIYAYFDADMAIPIAYLDTLIACCCRETRYDIATGSRYVKRSSVKRPFLRYVTSRSYNFIINLLFKTTIKDHECGFKAVTKDACDIILKRSIFDDWFWDTEILIIAHNNGLCMNEFPIEWEERRGTKTPLIRLLNDISIHSLGIVKLLYKNTTRK
jgi:glycosyltransferase involved in cell wall biosynthesis